ncbi:hypothetical protein [Novosphingobium sp. 9U]|uniref:hypothetical protein n=1 Tax=Novosphingobium sp. 9U TaxID=2653158 RepID=UPI0012F3F154|nr:hypothetical protein [Novosphingobium sp. 9U]VWX55197.1 Exonuclease SbcC [Novosphingobium sp. 9U]
MRTLTILRSNLANMADDFQVVCKAETLAGPGIFAMTGLTGADEPILLDAVFLKLFADIPLCGSGPPTSTAMSMNGQRSGGPSAFVFSASIAATAPAILAGSTFRKATGRGMGASSTSQPVAENRMTATEWREPRSMPESGTGELA